MERKISTIKDSEQAKIIENPQTSTVYVRVSKMLDLFGAGISNKSRNEGDSRLKVFSAELFGGSSNPDKLGITSYVDNESIMLYRENEKDAMRIELNRDAILDVSTYTRSEDGLLYLNLGQKTKGKPKPKPINQETVLGEINVLLSRTEDVGNIVNKNLKPKQGNLSPRRGLAIARKIINTGGQIVNGIIPR